MTLDTLLTLMSLLEKRALLQEHLSTNVHKLGWLGQSIWKKSKTAKSFNNQVICLLHKTILRSTFRGKDPPFSTPMVRQITPFFSMVRRHCYPGTTNDPYISTYGVELCTVFWHLIHVQFSRWYIFNVEFWPLYFLWMYSFDPYIYLNVESWPLYFRWKIWPPTCIFSLNVEFWPLYVVWIWTGNLCTHFRVPPRG